jgi:hypothetical protein
MRSPVPSIRPELRPLNGQGRFWNCSGSPHWIRSEFALTEESHALGSDLSCPIRPESTSLSGRTDGRHRLCDLFKMLRVVLPPGMAVDARSKNLAEPAVPHRLST